ncbi:MAG: amino acid ABC transporter substrate-binding protein [Erysipelotrichaceae bacterium]|nr:amino acid ABC transporter substrate-binding protein [Erysipelotrichaceae bacterium]
MKKLLVILFILVLTLSGCTTKKPTEDTLVIGLDDTFVPMGFRNEQNEIVGFDIDLAAAVSDLTGLKFTLQPIDWSLKETELNQGNIDMIWNGYSITDSRKEIVLFSTPYLNNRQIVVVLANSDITTLSDLADKVVSVQKDSSALEAVTNQPDLLATFKDGKVREFDSNVDLFVDLETGRSDAIILDEIFADYTIKLRDPSAYRVLAEDFGNEEYGIGFRKTDVELQTKINDAIQTLIDNGTFDQIKAKWFND